MFFLLFIIVFLIAGIVLGYEGFLDILLSPIDIIEDVFDLELTGEKDKGQVTRLWDVYLLGPFMIWFGVSGTCMPMWARVAMGISGFYTMAYNGRNYLRKQAA